jgi:hypothetical protein
MNRDVTLISRTPSRAHFSTPCSNHLLPTHSQLCVQRSTIIESCPTEVISSVLIMACSYEGRMGDALRLVSKRIVAQAKQY